MNLSRDLIKIGKRLDNRALLESKEYKITAIDKEIKVESLNTLFLLSLQTVKAKRHPEKREKGFLKIYGCDNKITEIYKKCINFDKFCKNDQKFLKKIFVKVRILEGNSIEGICLGINKLLEMNDIPVLYYPEVYVYSLNDSFVRDPSKNEMDGCLVVAKAKGIVLFAEVVDSFVSLCEIKKCFEMTNFMQKEEVSEENFKKIKR